MLKQVIAILALSTAVLVAAADKKEDASKSTEAVAANVAAPAVAADAAAPKATAEVKPEEAKKDEVKKEEVQEAKKSENGDKPADVSANADKTPADASEKKAEQKN